MSATLVLAAMALPAIAAAALAPPAAAARPPRLPETSETWIRAETGHFTLYSNASEEATIEIARRIELYRAVLASIGPALTVDSPLPTSIFVFRDAISFGPYKLLRKGEFAGISANIDGYFVQHPEGNYLAVNATPDSDPWPVIYHEYFHFFLYNNFTDIPLWLGEGLAECYGTFQPEGTSARIGGAIKSHQQWLKEHPLMPLPRLFAVGYESPEYQQRDKQLTFYAQSWALAHYLLWGPKGSEGPGVHFLRDLPRGSDITQAIAPALADPAALEERLAAHLRSRRFAFNEIDIGRLSLEGRPAEQVARVSPLPRGELLYRLGDLLLHSDDGHLGGAEVHFREAIRQAPKLAAAHAALGQALVGLDRRDEAKTAFERAFALDPDDPAIAVKFAAALVSGASPTGMRRVYPADALPPDLLKGRELFERVTRTSPGAAEAWAGLGSTYAYISGDLAPGIAALDRARDLMPSRVDIAVNLCWLYARDGRRSQAHDLYDRVISRSGDAAMRTAGREALFWSEVMEAVRAVEAGGPGAEAALERLARLADQAPSPASKVQVEAQLRTGRAWATGREEIDRYNEAVRLSNAGRHEEAAARLEALLAGGPAPEVAEKARRLLVEIRAIGLYNGAVDKYRKRDYRGALALLDRIPPEAKDHPVAAAAADLRKAIRTAMGQSAVPPK